MQELDELLGRLDMESYLDYAGLEYRHRSGSRGPQLNLKTCPSCGKRNWKVYIGAETGLGNCFAGGCELGTFNQWKFIKALLGNPSNGEIYQHIRQAAIELGWRPIRKAAAVDMVSGDIHLPSSIALPDIDGNVLGYLTGRGIGADVCRYFQLRYCHRGGYVFKVGDRKGSQDYSRRVVIPIFDLNGNMVTFQGRDVTGTAEDRYLFPPGLAASGRYLFNGHNAWHAKHLVLGEGAFDVFAMKGAFDDSVDTRHLVPIGSFGMHLSHSNDGHPSQLGALIELKRAGLEQLTLMWDGEKRALKAAFEAASNVRRIGVQACIAVLPPDKDPNEIPAEEVRKAFWSALDPSTSDGMTKLLRAML